MEYVYHESEGGMRFTSAIPSQSMPMRQGGGVGGRRVPSPPPSGNGHTTLPTQHVNRRTRATYAVTHTQVRLQQATVGKPTRTKTQTNITAKEHCADMHDNSPHSSVQYIVCSPPLLVRTLQ